MTGRSPARLTKRRAHGHCPPSQWELHCTLQSPVTTEGTGGEDIQEGYWKGGSKEGKLGAHGSRDMSSEVEGSRKMEEDSNEITGYRNEKQLELRTI